MQSNSLIFRLSSVIQLRIDILKTDKAHGCRASGSDTAAGRPEIGPRNTQPFELQRKGGTRERSARGGPARLGGKLKICVHHHHHLSG